MPARILVISAVHPPMWGPEGDHIMHLCQHLEAAGNQVHLLTSKQVGPSENPCVYSTVRSWGWRAMRDILRVIKQLKPDAIVLMYTGWMYKFHPMITLLPTAVRRMKLRIEFVTMITNAIGSKRPGKWRSKLIWKAASIFAGGTDSEFGTLLRDSDRIAILSEHHRKILLQKLPISEKKMVLIPPPPILHLAPVSGSNRAETRAPFGCGR